MPTAVVDVCLIILLQAEKINFTDCLTNTFIYYMNDKMNLNYYFLILSLFFFFLSGNLPGT